MIFHNKKCKAFPGREGKALPKGLLEYHCFFSHQQLSATFIEVFYLGIFKLLLKAKIGKNCKNPLCFPSSFLTNENNFIKCLILINIFWLLLPYLEFVRYLLYDFEMNVVSQKFLIVVRINMIKGAPKEVNDHFSTNRLDTDLAKSSTS